jgi:hypothetical protein
MKLLKPLRVSCKKFAQVGGLHFHVVKGEPLPGLTFGGIDRW